MLVLLLGFLLIFLHPTVSHIRASGYAPAIAPSQTYRSHVRFFFALFSIVYAIGLRHSSSFPLRRYQRARGQRDKGCAVGVVEGRQAARRLRDLVDVVSANEVKERGSGTEAWSQS